MDFLQLARKRYSCRKLSGKPVDQALIDRIIEAAIAAPTAVNKQPFRIWQMSSEKSKQDIRDITRYSFGADTFLVVGCKKGEAWVRRYDGKNFAEVDASIAASHMMMEITDLGLASTWVGSFDAPELKRRQPQMADYELIAIFPIGYPAEDAAPAQLHYTRKSRKELVETL